MENKHIPAHYDTIEIITREMDKSIEKELDACRVNRNTGFFSSKDGRHVLARGFFVKEYKREYIMVNNEYSKFYDMHQIPLIGTHKFKKHVRFVLLEKAIKPERILITNI